jgi:hypothetical protein
MVLPRYERVLAAGESSAGRSGTTSAEGSDATRAGGSDTIHVEGSVPPKIHRSFSVSAPWNAKVRIAKSASVSG